MEIFHLPASAKGQAAAGEILRSMLEASPITKIGGSRRIAVLRLTSMPAVLVKCEFLTNPPRLQFLADPANQRGLADAIALGVPQGI